MLGRLLARLALVICFTAACDGDIGGGPQAEGDTDEPPRWHFSPTPQPGGLRTLSAIWGASDGGLVVVGQYGLIMTNRDDEGAVSSFWRLLESPTIAHLTAVIGIEDGGDFGLPGPQGEMIAVGWSGTILHFHPNPDDDPLTDDGTWRLITGPEGEGLRRLLPVDPACPDYDGDGIADDGDGSGYSGDAPCISGDTTACDDNCRSTANGPQRPLIDVGVDGCVGPGDGPDPDATRRQRDADADGIGEACDSDDAVADPPRRMEEPLFGVFAERTGTGLSVVAVGGNGAMVTYDGPEGAATGAGPKITDVPLWLARTAASYRFDDDCVAGDDPRTCARLPVSCPAQCNPIRTDCNCPVDQGQCCDAGAATGVGCIDGSCGAAANACDAVSGVCLSLCPGCARRLDSTLRGLAAGPSRLLAVGGDGRILIADRADPGGIWQAPVCVVPPKPMDERPVLVGAAAAGDSFVVVGSRGALVQVDAYGGGCEDRDAGEGSSGGLLEETRMDIPSVFLSGAFATGATSGFLVGDGGTLLELTPGGPVDLAPPIGQSFYGIWAFRDDVGAWTDLWCVGAGGILLHAEYF